MKTTLALAFLTTAMCIPSQGQNDIICSNFYAYGQATVDSNLKFGGTGTTPSAWFIGDAAPGPFVDFLVTSNGSLTVGGLDTSARLIRLNSDGSASFAGGALTISTNGTLVSFTNIFWQTNIVWSTNAFFAPTNSQTSTVDMSIGYADIRIDGATSPKTFTAGTLLADSYQTACIFVRNYPATNTVRLEVANVPYIRGVPYVTNVSVLTVFTHNWTNDVWTNAVVLPLW